MLNQTAPAAVAPKGQADSSHWYGHTGNNWHPLYTPDKNYTLREARKDKAAGLFVVPSVTTIMKVKANRQVTDYLMKQTALAAHAEAQEPGALHPTNKEQWIEHVIHTANSSSKGAMDLGSRIHAAMELSVAGKDYDADMDVYVQAVTLERSRLGIKTIAQEKCVGSTEYGYAGKSDEFSECMTVSDYKSRKSSGRTPKVESYSTDEMQLAAYGYAEWGNAFFVYGRGIIFGISTSKPGLVTPHVFTGEQLVPAFEAFIALCAVWRYENAFDPRVATPNKS